MPQAATPHRDEDGPQRQIAATGRFPVVRWRSIEEGYVPHGPGLALGVHQDPVPAVQNNRLVVGVPDAAPNVLPAGAPGRICLEPGGTSGFNANGKAWAGHGIDPGGT